MTETALAVSPWIAAFTRPVERAKQLFWFATWFAVTTVAVLLRPSIHGHGTHQQLGLPPCPSVLLFDRPCPGCGLTTSWTAFVHGDFATSFHAHPLGPIYYLGFTATAIWALVGALRGVRLRTESQAWTRAITVSVVVLIGFGFVRMLMTPHYAAEYERQITSTYLKR